MGVSNFGYFSTELACTFIESVSKRKFICTYGGVDSVVFCCFGQVRRAIPQEDLRVSCICMDLRTPAWRDLVSLCRSFFFLQDARAFVNSRVDRKSAVCNRNPNSFLHCRSFFADVVLGISNLFLEGRTDFVCCQLCDLVF